MAGNADPHNMPSRATNAMSTSVGERIGRDGDMAGAVMGKVRKEKPDYKVEIRMKPSPRIVVQRSGDETDRHAADLP